MGLDHTGLDTGGLARVDTCLDRGFDLAVLRERAEYLDPEIVAKAAGTPAGNVNQDPYGSSKGIGLLGAPCGKVGNRIFGGSMLELYHGIYP